MIPTLEWTDAGVRFLDQTKLPLEETYVLATSYQQVADIIVTMVVRGAPAIGVSAAMGVALGVKQTKATAIPALSAEVKTICETLAATRPTAVNLFWAIERMRRAYEVLAESPGMDIPTIQTALIDEANLMYDEDIAACKAMGKFGAALMPQTGTVLTHCKRRRSGNLRLRHSARRHPRSRRGRAQDRRLRRRDAALSAGRAA